MSSSTSSPSRDPTPARPQLRLVKNLRNNVQSIFVGRGRDNATGEVEGSSSQTVTAAVSRRNSEGPKTPRFTITMPNLPSTRLNIPFLYRTTSRRGSSQSSIEPHSNVTSALPSPSIIPSRRVSSEPLEQIQRLPEPVVTNEDRRDRRDRFRHRSRRDRDRGIDRGIERDDQAIGVNPEEQELGEAVAQGRRRQERRKRRPGHVETRTPSASPSQRLARRKRVAVRAKIYSCMASGLFLLFLLIIYLALALNNKIASQEFHVIIILIILATTIFFCHSLIRLCIILLQPASAFETESPLSNSRRVPRRFPPGGGYANPEHPIQVQILRDEEAAGIESEATKFPPPAYGLWRESVRVDPNRIFWARNVNAVPAVPEVPDRAGDGRAVPRPPSYVSEDGVDYVVEARGRSIAPPSSSGPDAVSEISAEQVREYERRGRERGISLRESRAIVRRER